MCRHHARWHRVLGYAAGEAILCEAGKITVGAQLCDPKVLAMALLAHTMRNLNATTFVLQAGFVVEARTVTRCLLREPAVDRIQSREKRDTELYNCCCHTASTSALSLMTT
jgi:hypothetical protein